MNSHLYSHLGSYEVHISIFAIKERMILFVPQPQRKSLEGKLLPLSPVNGMEL